MSLLLSHRQDIRDFKAKNGLDTVIVLWTANTERFTGLSTPRNRFLAHRFSIIKN